MPETVTNYPNKRMRTDELSESRPQLPSSKIRDLSSWRTKETSEGWRNKHRIWNLERKILTKAFKEDINKRQEVHKL